MSRHSQFSLGLKQLGEGFGFLARHRSLWLWVFLPTLIGLILLFAAWGLFFHTFEPLSAFLFSVLGFDGKAIIESKWILWLLKPIFWILKLLVNLVVFIFGILLASLLAFICYLLISAPFLDLLAEKTTFLHKGEEPPPFSWRRLLKSIRQSVGVELQKAALLLAIPVFLWVLVFLPAVGPPVYLLLTTLFEMWALSFSTVDYPMSHKLIPFFRRLKWGWRHKYALTGFGFPFLIPFAPLLLQAPMVVGGTLLYHRLEETGARPPS